MPTWIAVAIVAIVGSMLVYWHFSGSKVMARRGNHKGGSSFDGISDAGGDHHADSSHSGGDGGDGGGTH
jgi:hypothetical protein